MDIYVVYEEENNNLYELYVTKDINSAIDYFNNEIKFLEDVNKIKFNVDYDDYYAKCDDLKIYIYNHYVKRKKYK